MSSMQFLLVGKKQITFTRATGAGGYVAGRWSPSDTKTVKIWCHIQPNLTKNDVQLLPEGDRSRNGLVLYCVPPLQAGKEGTALLKGDKFVWTDGFTYEIRWLLNYEMNVLNHYKAIAIRTELA